MPKQRRKNGGEPPKTVSCKFSKKEQALLNKLFGIDQSDKSEADYYKATKWWKAELEITQEDITDAIVQCDGKKHAKYREELMAVFNKIQQCIELHDMQKEMKQMASKKNPRRRKNTSTPPSSTWEKLGVMMDGTKLWTTLERQSEYRFKWTLYQQSNGRWSFSGGESRNYWDNDGKGYTYSQALKLIKQFDDADSIDFDRYNEDFNNNPRRRKNGTDMKYEIKINKTQQTALRKHFSGAPELSAMYVLADKAKKKTKSATVMTFMATDMFLDALVRELENSMRYTTKMNDRDWKALKSLRDKVKKLGMNDNPRRRKNTKSKGTGKIRVPLTQWEYDMISEYHYDPFFGIGLLQQYAQPTGKALGTAYNAYLTLEELDRAVFDLIHTLYEGSAAIPEDVMFNKYDAFHERYKRLTKKLEQIHEHYRMKAKGTGKKNNPRRRKNAQSEAKRAMDMHHKEGIPLKDAWAIVKGKKKPKRKNGTKKGQVRKTARRAYMKNPNKYTRKRGSHGRMMYFKNGKICSKETYTKKL